MNRSRIVAVPRIYLDHNAGAPLALAAQHAMVQAIERLGAGGNPSSIHGEGRAARDLVERARDQVAALVGVRRERVVLTSGGSEADALGVTGLLNAGRRRLITTRTEHPAVTGAANDGIDVTWLPVDAHGQWQPTLVAAALADGPAVVAASAVNHELGVVQPLAAIAAAVRATPGARLHVDAVQAAGRLPLAVMAALADTLAISAHKLGGPSGVGALIVGDALAMAAPWWGGMQERGRRPGTENVVGIVGFGAACAAAADAMASWPRVVDLGIELEAGLVALGARIHGAGAPRIGGTINCAFAGVPGDAVVMGLDLAGIAASTGAACSSGSQQPSPVMRALGYDDATALQAVRLSLGYASTPADIAAVLAALPPIVARIRRA